MIGKISYMTNSALVLRHDTLEVTGPSYPIGFVPDRTQKSEIPDRVRSCQWTRHQTVGLYPKMVGDRVRKRAPQASQKK